jgi:hypothetical protein
MFSGCESGNIETGQIYCCAESRKDSFKVDGQDFTATPWWEFQREEEI